MHSILERQLRRYLSEVEIPEELGAFLEAVNLAYEEADQGRSMLERALEISSSELLEAHARMRAALEALPDRFVILDKDLTIIDCRGGRPEQFKFHPEDVVGAPFSRLDARGQLSALKAAIDRSRESGKVESAEYVLDWEGRSEAYEARVFASPEGLVAVIVRNTTARRAASEALTRQERFLRHVLDLNPTLIFAKDREGRFTMVNKAVADAFGTTVHEMVGKRSRDFDVNAGTADISAADARVIDRREELVIPEKVFTDVSGQTRTLQMIKVPLLEPDGSCQMLLGVAVDITNRKVAEEELRARTEQILRRHAALEALALAPDGEPDDTLERITTVAARALGGVRASLLLFNEDRTALGLEVVCPEDGDAERPQDTDGLAAEACPKYLEALRVARVLAIEDLGGDERVSELAGSPMVDRDARSTLDVPIRVQGKVVGVLRAESIGAPRAWAIEDQDLVASIGDFASVALESGRRRKTEEQLFQSQKMEAIGLLAGGVAHDFNNLLGVILMATDVASESLDSEHPAAVDLRRVTEAALRAGDLTSKLLAFSRHETLQHQDLDLSRSVSAFTALLSRIMGEDVEVTTSIPTSPLTIKGDRSGSTRCS